MAMENLGLIDAGAAVSWREEVYQLNEETSKLLADVGTALQEVREDADSTIVDEIYKYGGQILTGTNEVLEGMNMLAETVTTILDKVNAVLDIGKNIVHGSIKVIAGLK